MGEGIMPVPAVMWPGMPTVSSGSQMTTAGSILGWKMIFFSRVSELVRRWRGRPPSRCRRWSARRRWGGCRKGRRGSTSRRYPRNPRRGGLARHEGQRLARSRPEPPPNAITPSSRPRGRPPDRRRGWRSLGFGSTSAKRARPRPASSIRSSVRAVISMAARPRSVTSSGREMPRRRRPRRSRRCGRRQTGWRWDRTSLRSGSRQPF
jgi:hypothetical protein